MKSLNATLLSVLVAPWICLGQTASTVGTNTFKGEIASLASSGAIVVGKQAMTLNSKSHLEQGGLRILASELRLGMEVSGVWADDGTNKVVIVLKAASKTDPQSGSPALPEAWKQDPAWTSNQTQIRMDVERRQGLQPQLDAARKTYFSMLSAGVDTSGAKSKMEGLRKQLDDLRWEVSRLRAQQWRIENRYRTRINESARTNRSPNPPSEPGEPATNGIPPVGEPPPR